MYRGELMEEAPAAELYKRGLHPYTKLLFSSASGLPEQVNALQDIPAKNPAGKSGVTPGETGSGILSSGCVFADRCNYAEPRCFIERPQMVEIEKGHTIRCFKEAGRTF
jgi:oligopeptide/dipeptide ABC transporter ATP-binding protein